MNNTISREFIRILAKKGRIEIIRTLRAHHDHRFSINELSRTSGIPTMTVWRAVDELKELGLVKTRKVGNSTSVRLTDDREKLRPLKILPDADPHKDAARAYSMMMSKYDWLEECRLFGTVGRGEHGPGEEVDVAVIFDDAKITEQQAKEASSSLSDEVWKKLNIIVVPLCVAKKDMSRKGGLAVELRDKETLWKRRQ